MSAAAVRASTESVRGRLEDLSGDRASMEAILSGMVEGVLVLDRQGRIQLVNQAAQAMLHVDATAGGRLYLEVIRHPSISEQLTAALAGAQAEPLELPPGVRSRFHGLRTGPQCSFSELNPNAHSWRLVRPMITAPASSARAPRVRLQSSLQPLVLLPESPALVQLHDRSPD